MRQGELCHRPCPGADCMSHYFTIARLSQPFRLRYLSSQNLNLPASIHTLHSRRAGDLQKSRNTGRLSFEYLKNLWPVFTEKSCELLCKFSIPDTGHWLH